VVVGANAAAVESVVFEETASLGRHGSVTVAVGL
jgi:hypothetical protein